MKKYWIYLGELCSPPLGKLLLWGDDMGMYCRLCDPTMSYSWILKKGEPVTWVLVDE